MSDWPNRLIDLSDVAVQSEPASGKVPVWNSTTKKWDWAAPAPAAHASTHQPGGSDAMAVDAATGTGSLRTIGKTALKAADGADTEYAFSAWKSLALYPVLIGSAAVASTLLVGNGAAIALNVAASAFGVMRLEPTDYSGGTRVMKVRVRGVTKINSTAPAATFTFGLYPVATWTSPGTNVRSGVATLGTAVCTTTIATPAANSRTHAESAAATLSTADWYVLTIATDATTATNSQSEVMIELQYQQV